MEQVTYEVRDGKALWYGRTLRSWADDIVRLVVQRFDPALVILFGSVAAGTDGPDSDIDILVVLDVAPPQRRYDLMVDLLRATRDADVPRDLLVTSRADFERRRAQSWTIESAASATGVVMHDRRRAA